MRRAISNNNCRNNGLRLVAPTGGSFPLESVAGFTWFGWQTLHWNRWQRSVEYRVFLALVFIGLLGGLWSCTPTPSVSGLPQKGRRCSAIDSNGNPFFYNDADKAVAMKRAQEKCENGSTEPFSCRSGSENCTQL